MPDPITREIASAVAWLDHEQVQDLLRLLVSGEWERAQAALQRIVPDLSEACDLSDEAWREALLDELDFRLGGPDDTDPDAVATREVPDYTRFAKDHRG